MRNSGEISFAFHGEILSILSYLCIIFQTKLLCQYVLQLAKYDQNYDVRDRARFVRALLFPSDNEEVWINFSSIDLSLS